MHTTFLYDSGIYIVQNCNTLCWKACVTFSDKVLTLESVSLLNLNKRMAKSVAYDVFSMEETLQ